MTQQGDVVLCQTVDGGEMSVVDGLAVMSGGLETAAYLSLFGGNEEDVGGSDTTLSWWGNLDEEAIERRYRSETQHLLESLPVTSGNLLRVEDAVSRDLAWMVTQGAAVSIAVSASLPAVDKVQIEIEGIGDSTLVFLENWQAAL